MHFDQETALELGRFLLQVKAVKLNDKEPFTWASGRKSPIYCDNRVTLSHPAMRTFIRQQFVKAIEAKIGMVDAVAGVATGGIPQGALVAQEMNLPFVYVRSEAKNHGMGQQIEGELRPGSSVVVVEDLISTGGSSLKAVAALREAGCTVKGMVAIFSYELAVAEKAFEAAQVPLYTLSHYNALLESALGMGILSEDEIASLARWRENPEKWSEERMGAGA